MSTISRRMQIAIHDKPPISVTIVEWGNLDKLIRVSDVESSFWLSVLSLGWKWAGAILFGLSFQLVVGSDSFQEGSSKEKLFNEKSKVKILPGSRGSDVFNSNVNSFFLISLSNLFLNYNTNTSWIDIENSSSSSVIRFMGHAFLLRTIYLYVNVLPESVFV